MAGYEKDEAPKLLDTHTQLSDQNVSISIPMNSMESYESETIPVGHTENLFQPNQGVTRRKTVESKAEKFRSFKDLSDDNYAHKNEHLLRSGKLGICNDPYCTTCPTYYNYHAGQPKHSKPLIILDSKFHNAIYGDAKGWVRRFISFLLQCIPGVMNPHAKVVQQWNKIFVISCLVAIFVDPLFFFLLSVQQDNKCIVIRRPLTTTIVVFRSINDFIYLLNTLLQFRLAYVAPWSRAIGAGELVDHPTKIALNYLSGYFLIDLFAVLPLPQIMFLFVLPKFLGSSGANYAKDLLCAAVLVQFIPRLYRFLPFLAGQSPIGFIFESAWANFVTNLLTYVLSGHVVGSCWYLFGLQRVNKCLRNACNDSGITNCKEFIYCGFGNIGKFDSYQTWNNWKNNENANACFTSDSFKYGIYIQAVNLTTEHSIITRYVYSLFWGYQQIITLVGNQTPSYFVWEVLFTMAIIGLGLLLFSLLIGDMPKYFQELGRRRLEMSLRRRDVQQWMSHRRLPEELRGRVREAERYNWAATRGVNEEVLFDNLPDDLQRDIRRHLFKFVKKVRLFAMMDDPILDAIYERLRQKTYIKESKIFYCGGLIEKMIFILRGKMESIGEDGIRVPLSEGDVCGEELLTWCLEHSSVNKDGKKIWIPGQRLLSNRIVRCLTNVEAFSLRAADIEEVTSLFARFLRNPRVQGAIRYESPYWRCLAATRIQVAWRYKKSKLLTPLNPIILQNSNTEATRSTLETTPHFLGTFCHEMGKNKTVDTGSNSKVSAQWDPQTTQIFVNLCLKEMDAGNHPGTHFNPKGWKNLIANFQEVAGREYDRKQLKNKWDGLKKEWKMWKQLIGKETGLGWNVKNQTVDADENWWKKKIAVNKEYEKFQKKGIPPELEDKLDRMFLDIVATGEDAWAPSSGILPHEGDAILVKGSDDSEEKDQNHGLDDIKPNVNGVSTQATIQDNKKKRVATNSKIQGIRGKRFQGGKGGKVGGAAKLSQQIDRLCDVVEKKGNATSDKKDLPGCSILEVIDALDNIPEIEPGGDLYMFATQLFIMKEKREMFVALKKPNIKVSWLQQEHAKVVQI